VSEFIPWWLFVVLCVAITFATLLIIDALRRWLHRAWHKAYRNRTLALENGRLDEALELSERMAEHWPLSPTPANALVEMAITTGHYRRALSASEEWKERIRDIPVKHPHPELLLIELNVTEALYNLGRFGCAERRLNAMRDAVVKSRWLLLLHGFRTQRAWLFMLRNRPKKALSVIERVNDRRLPRLYRAEVAFARAAVLRDLGRLDEARTEAERGRSIAKRCSSKRNALFLLGSIAARANDIPRAIAYLEEGAAHVYQGQGGDGLLLLGDLYGRDGRREDQKRAYEWAARRDPESVWGRAARRRLARMGE
jgi:tetratricopeptide (TPR) repeat protein